jgi:TctA family transporter
MIHSAAKRLSSKTSPSAGTTPRWLETEARVTACRYEFARMNTLTFGIPPENNRFLISFSYYAHARSYSDEFASPVALGNGATFNVRYNPLHPEENTKSASASARRSPLFALGVAGSGVLSLMYLSLVYGCN